MPTQIPLTPALSPVQERLLVTAERLLAEKGLGAVSTREVAREAGQKNHSALNYHFGSFDAVIEAILDYRMVPLNQRRLAMLAELEGQTPSLVALVRVIVEPLADELLRPPKDSRYLRLLSQLMSLREWQSSFTEYDHRSSALLLCGGQISDLIEPALGEPIALERMRLFGLHTLNSVTEWDAMGRRGELELSRETLGWRVENLVNYLTAALTAPI